MARSQAVDGGNGFHTWRVAEIVLNTHRLSKQRLLPGTRQNATQIKMYCSKILRKTETKGRVACTGDVKTTYKCYKNRRAENTFETIEEYYILS